MVGKLRKQFGVLIDVDEGHQKAPRPIGFSLSTRARSSAKFAREPWAGFADSSPTDLVSHVYVYALAAKRILELIGLH